MDLWDVKCACKHSTTTRFQTSRQTDDNSPLCTVGSIGRPSIGDAFSAKPGVLLKELQQTLCFRNSTPMLVASSSQRCEFDEYGGMNG